MKIISQKLLAVAAITCSISPVAFGQNQMLNTLGTIGSAASALYWAHNPRVAFDALLVGLGLYQPELIKLEPESKKLAIILNTAGLLGSIVSIALWWPSVSQQIAHYGFIGATKNTYTLRIVIDLIQAVLCWQRIQQL